MIMEGTLIMEIFKIIFEKADKCCENLYTDVPKRDHSRTNRNSGNGGEIN